ncbi:hypothetical protein [Draconibacterium halophilum]|uniref:Uncharacterized protein n=1 Tax=Draconibacterium halophilum TaxID=2706887 RepID=A0A6C0RGK7_9BACT|nr:hypothetical protein [Draconibacterium halophilum]QIA08805.1 hypothetical protein G0Q07_14230 [Draconibacterium halophilum]
MEQKRKDAYEEIFPILSGLSISAIELLLDELKTLTRNCPIDSSSNPFR